ncbi:hypothetical protein, partial [Pseudomonas sp. O11]|uniref:hypothetical protein n=1 Tax=Pseudomonas sp. O11 TaxID=3159446 RepID=UPI00387B5164
VCERTTSLLECGTRRKALERRVDVLEGLLRDASAWIKHNSFHGTDAIELWERIDAALKPVEGGGDEA